MHNQVRRVDLNFNDGTEFGNVVRRKPPRLKFVDDYRVVKFGEPLHLADYVKT